MNGPRVLQTDRLTGRPFRGDDWPLIHELQSDPETAPWLLAPGVEPTESRARDVAERFAESWLANGFGPYLWRLGPKPIGYAGLRPSRLEGMNEIEALWAVTRPFRRRGYAVEATRGAMRADAFGPSLCSWTLPGNAASIGVMKALDFIYERDAEWAGLAHVVYRRAWP